MNPDPPHPSANRIDKALFTPLTNEEAEVLADMLWRAIITRRRANERVDTTLSQDAKYNLWGPMGNL